MTTDALPIAARQARVGVPVALRLALRELRTGLGGFAVFIACIALGVTVITGVGALSDALRGGFERQGEVILGGDLTLARMHARASDAERQTVAALGRLSETATMRTMGRRTDGTDQSLIELQAVDTAYPLSGQVRLQGATELQEALGTDPAGASLRAAVDPLLLERLKLAVGDKLKIGAAELTITAAVTSIPDMIASRITYGPRVLVSLDTLEKTGLIQPGSLVRWRYALKLDADGPGVAATREAIAAKLPDAGFTLADRRDPSPNVTRTIERLRQFLTLLGLTALLVGGVGVANAVATFIDRRRKTIAILKSVGATSRTVTTIFLTQVLIIALIGIAIGLALGYLVALVLNTFYGDALPIAAEIRLGWQSIAFAAAYGVLVTLIFTLWPLGRAGLIKAAVLFRDDVGEARVWPRWPVWLATGACIAGLAALAIATSDSRKIAIYFAVAVAVVFAVFSALGWLVTAMARRAPHVRRAELALALGNLGAPGGLTRSVIMSLGAGLSLLVAVALADASLVRELETRLPANSPDYFVLDINKDEYPAFTQAVTSQVPGTRLDSAPMLRGRLLKLNGVPSGKIKAPPEAQWVLSGDRGLTYAEAVPDGSKVIEGEWWEPGYAGEPLVSFEEDLGKKLGLALGDTVTVNVLGRNVTARIANFRKVEWESLAINFVMVFSPNTLAAAPHNLLATIVLPAGTALADEARVARAIATSFPTVTAIRVKDAIAAFRGVFAKVVTAIRVAGSVTLLAGALVLAGALATAQRRRILQAVILKTLGATRARIIGAHMIEYLLAALVTGLFAVGLGALAAYIALTEIMDVPFTFAWSAVIQALALAIGLVLIFGGLGTWQVLKARPVPYLRSE